MAYVDDNQLKALEARLSALEARKVKVSDLPLETLRTKLAEVPMDPLQQLLPKSVTGDLIATNIDLAGAPVTINPAGAEPTLAELVTALVSAGIIRIQE